MASLNCPLHCVYLDDVWVRCRLAVFVFNKIDTMDIKIGFENEFDRCRGNTWTMCEFRDSNGNGFRDICWTDKLFYFSSIDTALSFKTCNSPKVKLSPFS